MRVVLCKYESLGWCVGRCEWQWKGRGVCEMDGLDKTVHIHILRDLLLA